MTDPIKDQCGLSHASSNDGLIERLRSRAWEHRHHRKYREEAAKEIELLRAQVAALRRGEFICQRCALRKDDEHPRNHDF